MQSYLVTGYGRLGTIDGRQTDGRRTADGQTDGTARIGFDDVPHYKTHTTLSNVRTLIHEQKKNIREKC